MHVIVPIKQVPETGAVKLDEQTGTMIREGVEAIVNPLDLYAIEAALQIRENMPDGDCRITAISMGPAKAASALREVVSMGVNSAVLLCDSAFAGSDTWATAFVLAKAIEKLAPFDLIICGERATDGETGQVGPELAAFCDLPVATYVSRIDAITDGLCRAHRLVETGYEVLEMDLPGLVTVMKEIASPRLPTLTGKRRAKALEIPIWGAADLGIEPDKVGLAGSPTKVVKIHRPTVARNCRKIAANDPKGVAEAANELVEFLKEKNLI